MGLRVMLDFGTNSELLYSKDGKEAKCKVESIFYGEKGSMIIGMVNLGTGKKFSFTGYELSDNFKLIKK